MTPKDLEYLLMQVAGQVEQITGGRPRIELIIHNAPHDTVRSLTNEDKIEVTNWSDKVTVYSTEYTPFEIKPKELLKYKPEDFNK